MALIEHMKKRRRQGNKIILWSCRVGERLQEAVNWCREYDLEFDAVNENLPETIEQYGGDGRKIHADVYIDDKAVNKQGMSIMFEGGKDAGRAMIALCDKIQLYESLMRGARPFGGLFCYLGRRLPVLIGEWEERFEQIEK